MFCTIFPLEGRMSKVCFFFTILFFQSSDVFDYLARLQLRTCDSLVLSGRGRKHYASSLQKSNLSTLCRGRGFVVGRFRRRHSDGGGGLRAFATMRFPAKRDTAVFTGSYHRTSPASKQHSWKAPVAENRMVLDRCVAHAAVKVRHRSPRCYRQSGGAAAVTK